MLTAFAIGTALTVLVGILFAAALWITRSWEVVDDDEALYRLERDAGLRGWFRYAPRLLTYRRDKRGRFRRHRR